MGDVADPVGKRNVGQVQPRAKPKAQKTSQKQRKIPIAIQGARKLGLFEGFMLVLRCGAARRKSNPLACDLRRWQAVRPALATIGLLMRAQR